MSLVLISTSGVTTITASYRKTSSEYVATCYFDMPTFNSATQRWEVCNIYGTNTEGNGFEYGTLDGCDLNEEDRINPTKVFWWVANKIKGVLCPSCM